MKKCTDRSDGREILTGVLCWIVYFSIYPGRLNFSAGMSEMLETGCWEKGQNAAALRIAAHGTGAEETRGGERRGTDPHLHTGWS